MIYIIQRSMSILYHILIWVKICVYIKEIKRFFNKKTPPFTVATYVGKYSYCFLEHYKRTFLLFVVLIHYTKHYAKRKGRFSHVLSLAHAVMSLFSIVNS